MGPNHLGFNTYRMHGAWLRHNVAKCIGGSRWVLVLALVLTACAPAASPAPVAPPTTQPAIQPTRVANTPTPAPPVVSVSPTPGNVPARPTPASASAPTGDASPKPGGVLTSLEIRDPPSFDPGQETTIFTLLPAGAIFNGLVQFSPKDPNKREVVGDLAKSWEASSDGTTWTFRLKDGVRFQDGQPLTSADVAFTINRMKAPPAGVKPARKDVFAAVKDVSTPDASTVTIRLDQPRPWLLELLANPSSLIVPKHIVEKDQHAIETRPMGSGPFRFKGWNRGVDYAVEKNQSYFERGQPLLDGIQWFIIPDVGTGKAAVRAGKVLMSNRHALTKIDVNDLKRGAPDFQVFTSGTTSRYDIIMNTKAKPFTDARVRQAVLQVLDQQSAIDAAFDGAGFRSGIMPPGPWALPEETLRTLPPYRGPTDTDIAKAKQLLQEAGLSGNIPVVFTQGNAPNHVRMNEVAAAQMRKIGFAVTSRVVVYPTELDPAIRRGDFQIAMYPAQSAFLDPDSWLASFVTGNVVNWSQVSDPEIDKLYEQQSKTADYTARKKLVDQLQMRIWQVAPQWTMAHPQFFTVAAPAVKGYEGALSIYDNNRFTTIWIRK